MQRQLRSCLNLVQPSLSQGVSKQQNQQKKYHGKHAKSRSFQEGEEVFVKNYGRHGNPWLDGIIVALSGPVSVIVELLDGIRVKHHFEQLRKRHVKSPTTITDKESALPEDLIHVPEVRLDMSREQTEREVNDEISPLPESMPDSESGAQTPELSMPSPREVPSAKRYPSRIRQPPNRFGQEI